MSRIGDTAAIELAEPGEEAQAAPGVVEQHQARRHQACVVVRAMPDRTPAVTVTGAVRAVVVRAVEVVVRLIEPATRVHDLPEPAVRPALAGIAQAFEARLRQQPARQPTRLVLADELAIEGDRQAEGRERPAKIGAGHLVARRSEERRVGKAWSSRG